MKDKNELRKRIREEKCRRSADDLMRQSHQVMAQVEALPAFAGAKTVALYWSLPDEVYTHDFIEKWCARKTIVLPVMCGGELTLKPFTCREDLCQAPCFGIMEPVGREHPVENLDLIVVPGMAFDTHNNRMGRGRGFYDKLLKNSSAIKVGVCFEFQFFEHIPAEEHDIKMDIVLKSREFH